MPKPARKEPLDVPAMIAEVRAWLPEIEPLARVEQSESDGTWSLEVAPARDGACRFSLFLAADGKYDLFVGELFSQEHWDWPEGIRALDLCRAIAAGWVTEQMWRSKWLDLPVRNLVAVELPSGNHWSDEHRTLLPFSLAWCRLSERQYRPYG